MALACGMKIKRNGSRSLHTRNHELLINANGKSAHVWPDGRGPPWLRASMSWTGRRVDTGQTATLTGTERLQVKAQNDRVSQCYSFFLYVYVVRCISWAFIRKCFSAPVYYNFVLKG